VLDKAKKQGWRQVKFGDVVRQVKERVDPETSGLERYVAGDHMDTDDLRIRRWGEIGSGYLGPAFHMRFRPGQVLYGSRRTYLRKVAVADFDGICANTTFVIEPKDAEELLPEFLPFLMQTDAFNEFSVKNSKGSVNPYINFSDLARFEFALPPLEEQRKAAEALELFDEQSGAFESLISTARQLQRALSIDHFDADHPNRVSVANVGTWHSGGTPARGNPSYWGGSIPWISPKDMKAAELGSATETVTPSGVEAGSKLMPADTIMIVVRGMILAHTFPVARTLVPAAFNQDMKALVVSDSFRPKYIQYWFEHSAERYLQLVSASSHGTKRLESDKLFSLSVPAVSLDEQDVFIAQIDALRQACHQAEQRRQDALAVKRAFLNGRLFSEVGE
tara:strand:+ start:737 stop:1912 length:1176 start_codon:yes stop_codon:yes gene_type:complete